MITSDVAAELPDGPHLTPAETTFQWLARPFALLDECAARHGDTFTLRYTRFGTHVVVAHPEDVREVFAGDHRVLHAGRGNALLEPILGRYSLLLADGDQHLAQRADLALFFRPDRMPHYAAAVVQATRRWTAAWNGGSVIRMQRTALEISKAVILRIVLGVSGDQSDRLSRLIDRLMLFVGTNAAMDEGSDDARVVERFRAARGALDAALQEHIEARRTRAGAGDGADDLLGLLLERRCEPSAAVSDEVIRDQLLTMLLAGHETTASSITWALVCLQEQPAAAERLAAELDEAGAGLAPERLSTLPYLQAVCLEALRLRPVVPVVSRELQQPFRLRDRTLPAGIFVTPCAYLAHRRPAAFPEPDVFRPERFLERRFPPHVYFPFGGGVRRCIGMGFALLEMQIVLGMLLRDYRFTLLESVRPVRRAVTIVASGGGKMHVERRQPQ